MAPMTRTDPVIFTSLAWEPQASKRVVLGDHHYVVRADISRGDGWWLVSGPFQGRRSVPKSTPHHVGGPLSDVSLVMILLTHLRWLEADKQNATIA